MAAGNPTVDDAEESITLQSTADAACSPLWLVTDRGLEAWLAEQPAAARAWAQAQGFTAEKGRVLTVPAADGTLGGAVLGLGGIGSQDELDPWNAAALADRLPPRLFALQTPLRPAVATQFALGWLLGGYRFTRYRSTAPGPERARLVAPPGADLDYARSAAVSMNWARDLINTPANDLGPQQLVEAAQWLAHRFAGTTRIVSGSELDSGYPLIAAVGRGSARAPCLIDCRWGAADAPRVTLVGKGVCFDTGGLDVKPSAGMLLMKKDMGGAASALALASLLLRLRAPVQLRLLIAAVENSIDANAYRPGDVCRSRKGLTVEINNTDAEGRLVLADALADADAEQPDLLIDLATLTGAARVALGPELPAAFSNDDDLLAQLHRCSLEECDPLWPMPLWAGYEDELASRVADVSNVSSNAFAGATIAALFLRRFVTATAHWLHVDLYAWNSRDRPGRPLGAEIQTVRSLYALIRRRFG